MASLRSTIALLLTFSLFACSLLACSQPARAAEPSAPTDPALRAVLSQLFNDTWEKSADGITTAERLHLRARELSASDPRVDFALALVQLHYLRFSEAERTLTVLQTASPDYWPAAQAKIHLAILMKKYSAALPEIDRFSERVAATAIDSGRAEARREAAEFLGRIFGYLEGPAAKAVSQAAVADVRARVLTRLASPDREAFSAAFGSVNERFTQLDEETRRTKAESIAVQQEQKELDLKRLQTEQASLAGDKESIRKQAQEAFDTARAKTAALDQQLAPLDAAFGRLVARSQLIRGEIAQLDNSVASLLTQAQLAKDPLLKVSLLQQADLISNQIRAADFALRNVDAEAAQVNAQREALLRQRSVIVEQYQGDAKRLGVEAAKLGRTEKRNVVQQKEAIKPPNGFTPQVQTKTTAAASITSYVEFPLEREKLRLLDSLR
ncbi:MAG: hypothetical protein K8U03_11170 [Planctomycetia bacterium]|nr:hypothetical protein [Planctomycetia bacterium]